MDSQDFIEENPTILASMANGNLAQPISLTEVIESMG